MTKRWIIVGAGAVGGTLAMSLIESSQRVCLVARGAHANAIDAGGLRLIDARGERRRQPAEVWRPGQGCILPSDHVVIATKSQDTVAVLRQLPGLENAHTIICAQNGVTNEAAVSARSPHTIGAMVWMPAVHLRPGVIECHGWPRGYLVLGRWPKSPANPPLDVARAARDLTHAGLVSRAVSDIRRYKLGKLLTNLANVVDALCLPTHRQPLVDRLQTEARHVLIAAELDFMDPAELIAEATDHVTPAKLRHPRGGGSTWQSAVRRQPLETEHLNGFVTALAKHLGIAAPANQAMVDWSRRFVADPSFEPRSLDARTVLAAIPPEHREDSLVQ